MSCLTWYLSKHFVSLLIVLVLSPAYISLTSGVTLDSPPYTTTTTSTTSSITTTANTNTKSSALSLSEDLFDHISDEIVFQSPYRSIIRRKIKSPSGHIADYDILDQRGTGAVIIFAWNSTNKTVTLIREYMPASKKIFFGLAAGLVEDKHDNYPFIAAQHELEEECYLKGGTWFYLLDEKNNTESSGSGTTTVSMDKYCTTNLYPYIVINPERICSTQSMPRDLEEDIEVVEGIDIDTLWRILKSGKMNAISSWACLLALQKLNELGEI